MENNDDQETSQPVQEESKDHGGNSFKFFKDKLETESDNGSVNSMESEDKPMKRNFRALNKATALAYGLFGFLFSNDSCKDDVYETAVIQAHYMFMSKLMLLFFMFSTSMWYSETNIVCVDKSNMSPAPENCLQHCLAYPFKEVEKNGDRQIYYVIHYMWIHWAFLIVALCYKFLSLIIKIMQPKEFRNMLDKLSEIPSYQSVDDRFILARDYYLSYYNRHGYMYVKYMVIHVIALGINAFSFLLMNITLQGKYTYLPYYLTILRDIENFEDEFSLIFPPFVDCEINPEHHILVETTKRYGCHLTLMEVYEKMFMILWFTQAFLALWTILYLVYNFPFPCSLQWKRSLLHHGPYSKYYPFSVVAKHHSTDDLLAFRCVVNYLDGQHFRLLVHVVEEENNEMFREEVSNEEPHIGFEGLDHLFNFSNQNGKFDSQKFEMMNQSTGFLPQENVSPNSNVTNYYTPHKAPPVQVSPPGVGLSTPIPIPVQVEQEEEIWD